ncbi:D-alanyl-D-alanine carboxypeptidase/D-alanyl-D-alanine-endopeptidase [Ulvibacterium sp.]|uniref:D-alanyl-D-alanine carboxypeptidase/D-alanyl-D-alanine-endopeptidase n=1 Tax=Ulvibacterium sp. TaxID=2665914 RepID=UPI002612B1EE|nr:D-alanyl-D-alanine carboxypeptidase [Ulvibacterium sp.]
MGKILSISFILIFLLGCVSSKGIIQKNVRPVLEAQLFENQFTGFFVVDPEKRDTLYSYNSEKYFTPASNTKIYTLFTSLELLPDSIPALKYNLQNDTLFVEGTGDPSFLHPYFKDSTALHFLKKHRVISLYVDNFQEEHFGPGWAWGDYQWYYSTERSAFPLYGNVLTVYEKQGLQVSPALFEDKVIPIDYVMQREENENRFYFDPTRKDTVEIPLKLDSTLIRTLLEDALQRKVSITPNPLGEEKSIVYSVPSDSIYAKMMMDSDNFLAEQLLILASSTLSDTLNTGKVRNHVLDSLLTDLRQPPRWVDGSGLSRYNLFTPQSMVHVLHLMYQRIPRQRLFSLFPAGGVSGTLENWYPGDPTPYIYAKTGSLGNNHCVSGYLLTKSGKTLIFSFMNNHFRIPSSEVKKRMQSIFETIRDTY